MPTKRISEQDGRAFVANVCTHRDHNPSQHIQLAPGTYEHECEGCHRRIVFTVPEGARFG